MTSKHSTLMHLWGRSKDRAKPTQEASFEQKVTDADLWHKHRVELVVAYHEANFTGKPLDEHDPAKVRDYVHLYEQDQKIRELLLPAKPNPVIVEAFAKLAVPLKADNAGESRATTSLNDPFLLENFTNIELSAFRNALGKLVTDEFDRGHAFLALEGEQYLYMVRRRQKQTPGFTIDALEYGHLIGEIEKPLESYTLDDTSLGFVLNYDKGYLGRSENRPSLYDPYVVLDIAADMFAKGPS